MYDFKPKGKPCRKKKLFTRGKKICLRYGNWLKRIRIAFEHENAIDGTQGAYQEICHLITVKAENKVLVGYLANHTPQEYAEDFQSIIKDSGTKDNVLLILGNKKSGDSDLRNHHLKTYTFFLFN